MCPIRIKLTKTGGIGAGIDKQSDETDERARNTHRHIWKLDL